MAFIQSNIYSQCDCYTYKNLSIVGQDSLELTLHNSCDNNVYLNFYLISSDNNTDTLARLEGFSGFVLPLNTDLSFILMTSLTSVPSPGTFRVALGNGAFNCDSLGAASPSVCDSLDISFAYINQDTLVINVSNNSQTTLFDYPGFMLMDSSGIDTLGMENVDYFGIGSGIQQHYIVLSDSMVYQNYLNGQINTILHLYTGFYDSLVCQVPFFLSLTALNDFSPEDSFRVYPNPAESYINIDFEYFSSEKYDIILRDATGKLLINQSLTSSKTRILTADLPKGIYFLTVINSKGWTVGQGKIIKIQ